MDLCLIQYRKNNYSRWKYMNWLNINTNAEFMFYIITFKIIVINEKYANLQSEQIQSKI